ncbi:MAG: hypothetical protein KC621_02880 [Myxococcales bacterium]|nr:hypothetical protein [Myxococcales bacterium]
MLTWLVVTQGALAADTTLTWDLSVKGVNVGSRELTVRTMDGADGQSRILESFTDINGMVGPLKVRWRQRMTAHVDAREPAAFTSVVDQNGSLLEIQGRWTPTGWQVTTTTNGRSRATDMPLSRVDLSTADLMDPSSRLPLSHYDEVRVLSAESGEVLVGPVEKLGVSEVSIDGQAIQVTGYAWTSPQGRSELMFSADGWLVKYSAQLLGIQVDAVLRDPPPGGSDDFPVAVRPPKVEALDL